MSTINQVTGKRYRILKDAVNKIWDEISFRNIADDCIANDGMSLEQKVGDIKGLVSTPQSNVGYVMDATVVAPIYKVLTGVIRPDGALSLTFIDPLITSTTKFVIYTDLWGYSPEEVVVSGNILTLNFPQPDSLVQVRIEIGEFNS